MGLKFSAALLLLGLIAIGEINGYSWYEHEKQHDDDDMEEEDPWTHNATGEEQLDTDDDDFQCLTHSCTFENGAPPTVDFEGSAGGSTEETSVVRHLEESCGSCNCAPKYTMGDCVSGLECQRNPNIPNAAGKCVRPVKDGGECSQCSKCQHDNECSDTTRCVKNQCIDPCKQTNSCGQNSVCQPNAHFPVCNCRLGWYWGPYGECTPKRCTTCCTWCTVTPRTTSTTKRTTRKTTRSTTRRTTKTTTRRSTTRPTTQTTTTTTTTTTRTTKRTTARTTRRSTPTTSVPPPICTLCTTCELCTPQCSIDQHCPTKQMCIGTKCKDPCELFKCQGDQTCVVTDSRRISCVCPVGYALGDRGECIKEKKVIKCQDNNEFQFICNRINNYRVSQGLSKLHKSKTLCNVADFHTQDLIRNKPQTTFTGGCASGYHSWSTQSWCPACCYDKYRVTRQSLNCMWNKPRQWNSRFPREFGYEIEAHRSDRMTSTRALNQWKRDGNNDVILQKGKYQLKDFYWIGGYMRGGHAVVWFA